MHLHGEVSCQAPSVNFVIDLVPLPFCSTSSKRLYAQAGFGLDQQISEIFKNIRNFVWVYQIILENTSRCFNTCPDYRQEHFSAEGKNLTFKCRNRTQKWVLISYAILLDLRRWQCEPGKMNSLKLWTCFSPLIISLPVSFSALSPELCHCELRSKLFYQVFLLSLKDDGLDKTFTPEG